MAVKCGVMRASGEPCRAWAVRGSDPPRCSAHAGRNVGAGAPSGNQNAARHGFYGREFTDQELADLVTYAGINSLDDEIALARVAVRRVMEQVGGGELPAEELMNGVQLVLTGTRTVARLLRDARALQGKAADGIAGAIAQALDELATEWGVEL